jgi:hypothetical protein
VIGGGLIVLEQPQKLKDPRAGFRRGARSRMGHVGNSQTNKSRKNRIEPDDAPEGPRYFIATAESMNFLTTKAL